MTESASPDLVVSDDGLARPVWAATDPLLREYYDTEWGMPVRDERGVFERLSLEAFQSGLSWATILRKRPAFRDAFSGFDPEVVAGFGDEDVARLLSNAAIVRNRAKILATIANARATLAPQGDGQRRRRSGGPGVVLPAGVDSATAPACRHPHSVASVGGPVPRAQASWFPLRRSDDDARPHGGDRDHRYPPGRLPPPWHLRSLGLGIPSPPTPVREPDFAGPTVGINTPTSYPHAPLRSCHEQPRAARSSPSPRPPRAQPPYAAREAAGSTLHCRHRRHPDGPTALGVLRRRRQHHPLLAPEAGRC